MLAEEERFLAAIYEDPENDAKRLIYADWLQERSDPRGEFIALQFNQRSEERARQREAQLLTQHRVAWLGPLAMMTSEVVFERGFPAVAKVERLYGGLDAPQWYTLRELDFENVNAMDIASAVRYLSTFALREVRGIDSGVLEDLNTSKTPHRLQQITLLSGRIVSFA